MSTHLSKMFQSLFHLVFSAAHKELRFRAAFILYFLILALGSVPGARSEIGQLASGLMLHAVAYSIIAFLLFTGSNSRLPRKSLQTILLVALMGAMDEYVQSFFAYRVAAVDDWIVDVIAGSLTVLLSLVVGAYLTNRQRVQGVWKDGQ